MIPPAPSEDASRPAVWPPAPSEPTRVGYGAARPPFQSQRGIATWIYVLAALHVLQTILLATSELGYWHEDQVSPVLRIFYGLWTIAVVVGLGVVFLMWVYASTKNVEAFLEFPDISPGWAVGYYFIPILSLYKPYQNRVEVWEKSESQTSGDTATALLGWWWGFYILSNSMSWPRYYILRGQNGHLSADIEAYVLACHIVGLVALALMVAVVRALNIRQDAKEQTMRGH